MTRDRVSARARLSGAGACLGVHVAMLALCLASSSIMVWALRMVDTTTLYGVAWRSVFDVVDLVYVLVFAVAGLVMIVLLCTTEGAWRLVVACRRRAAILPVLALYSIAGGLSCAAVIAVYILRLAPPADLKDDMKIVGGLLAIFGFIARRFWPDEAAEPRTGEAAPGPASPREEI